MIQGLLVVSCCVYRAGWPESIQRFFSVSAFYLAVIRSQAYERTLPCPASPWVLRMQTQVRMLMQPVSCPPSLLCSLCQPPLLHMLAFLLSTVIFSPATTTAPLASPASRTLDKNKNSIAETAHSFGYSLLAAETDQVPFPPLRRRQPVVGRIYLRPQCHEQRTL